MNEIGRMRKSFSRLVPFLAFFMIFSALFSAYPSRRAAEAHNSKEWKERLAARTVTLWIEGQTLGDGIMLNARGELSVTWLERGLTQTFTADNDVDEWVEDGLNYYFSSRKETRARIKGRDVFVLHYRAAKNWSFDPAKLTIGGYTITPDDILTKREYWEGDLPVGGVGTVAVAAPSIKPGRTVELRYEDAAAEFKVPRDR